MRKHCNRKPLVVAKPLTPAQHTSLVMAPQVHLEMLLEQVYETAYAASISRLFNLTVILAYLQNQALVKERVIAAQQIMGQIIDAERPPNADEGSVLQDAINLADRYIGLQNTADMARAINFAERKTADIRKSLDSYPVNKPFCYSPSATDHT